MVPIGKGRFGGIKGIVTALVIVGPVRLGEARLNLTALSTRRDRTGSRTESNFQIEVCARARRIDLHEGSGDAAAVAGDGGMIAEEVLSRRSFARIPVPELQLTERHTAAARVDDIEVRLDLVITGIGICRSILHSQRTGTRRCIRTSGCVR